MPHLSLWTGWRPFTAASYNSATTHLLRQHAPVQNDSLVRLAQPFQMAVGHWTLGHPGRHVLTQYEVGDVPPVFVGHGDVVVGHFPLLIAGFPRRGGVDAIHYVPGMGVVYRGADLEGPADPQNSGE